MKTRKRSRLLAGLLVLVMVMTLMPAAAFAADPAANAVTATKLTAEPADWSGEYLLIYEDGKLAFDGSLETVDAASNTKAVTMADGVATADAGCVVTIEKVEGGYVMKTVGGLYIYAPSNANTLSSSADKDTAAKHPLTLSVGENGETDIVSEMAHMRFNKASDQMRFRFYKSATYNNQQPVALYKVGEQPVNHVVTDLAELTDGAQVVIFNPAYGKALSSVYSGYYNSGVDVALKDEKLDGYNNTEIWTVGVNEDKSFTFSTEDGKKLSMGASFTSMPLDDVNTVWEISAAATEGCFYIKNVSRNNYIEWYNDKGNWSSFGTIGNNEALFAQQFYLIVEEPDTDTETGLPDAGDQVVIYNQNAQGVLAAENDSQSIENAPTTISDGKAVPGNGGVVFTVEKNGEYWRFKNDTYGYLCSNGTGNNAFYSKDFSEEGVTTDDADWLVRTCSGGVGGYEMESRTAKYNGTYSQWLEYYADSYKTYSMYKVTDYTIYSFYFYPVAEGVSLSGGVVNMPAVSFNAPDAYVGQDYTLTFTVDAVFGVQELTVMLGDETLQATEADGIYTVVIPAEKVAGDKLSVTVSGKDTKDAVISGSVEISVKDEPVITDVTPKTGSETGDNKKPEISAVIVNAGPDPKVEMKVNDTAVEAAYADGKVSYTPAEDMADGRVNVIVTVTRSDGKTAEKSWSFTVGEAQYKLYYGQLHSHTGEYSDGSGTLQQALEYVKSLPESANVDFVAFTDHSNYFDASGNANPEDALYDMSKATAQSQEKWAKYKSDVAAFNEANAGSLVAVAGFEMTWSGGPGHINTFNTPGIVSRNNSTLNNKTDDAGMKAYYSLLSRSEGADSISQFNHPGSTFGTFTDFSYWDAVIDSRIFLVEVGNGEGQIGAGGYYPSYEYYTMALDKGWHVAPTNNQDNHKGKWGNANDARDVILTDNFTEEGVYDAIRAMRVYSTEDKNLELYYTVNGMQLGSSITEIPDKLDISVQVSDPDSSDSISKVEVIVNSGKSIHTWSDPAELAKGDLSVTLDPDYSYYYIRVTEGDGDLAVTAPVWVGESLKLGISSVECGTSTPVTGEELELTTTIFNSEASEAVIKSVTYTVNGSQVIGTQTDAGTVGASENKTLSFKYTPDKAKVMKVTVTVVLEQDGKEYTFSKDIELDILNADDLVYIGIDAAHYNEYVAGNYKDSMGNFGNLAAGYSVRTVELETSEDLIAACSNDKYKALILTAPSRRLADAQADPRTYSADEINAIVAFNKAGGIVILAGWSDNYENYSVIQENDAIKHMAATQNELLAALGSSLRISDDATYDDVRSAADGVDKWRLYFNTYGDGFLTSGIEVDAEHPYDRLYTEVFSHYGGASVYAVDANGDPTATLPSTVYPVVYGHSSTYSVDVDKDGLGGDSTPKYAYADGDNRLMAMASEQLSGQGLIIVSGAAFMSNFEVQATISDNGSEKNYSNYKICENLVQYINPVKVTDIATVQKQTEVGVKYTIEGIVTSNASGYDKDTAFFDCIYIQDETAGICCFPVAGDYKIGDKVRITGSTDFYQGEMELQVTSIQKIGEGSVTAKNVTAAQINDGSVLGALVTIKGTVVSFELENGLIQTIMVKDAAGNTARVFIDGYITKDNEVKDLAVGKTVSVTGLASYDNTFNAPDGPFPRIRVRDRADVVVGTTAADPFKDISTSGYYKYIVEAANVGIIAGYPDGTYRPNNVVTRAQFITMLYRAAGSPEVKNSELEFSDADTIAKPFVTAVAWGVENKVISGYGDNTFRPDQNISRAQMATFMYRYMKDVAGYDFGDVKPCGFEDANQIAAPFVDAVNAIVSAGVMNGMNAKTFAPNNTANRGMAATVILRVHNLTA
ncbi:MAG: S-layer homology domain-containing protein [Oscillospiraceae bacterium]|nr:S-layer homology domain-containing protein [Oscillospiraceae bacterium]